MVRISLLGARDWRWAHTHTHTNNMSTHIVRGKRHSVECFLDTFCHCRRVIILHGLGHNHFFVCLLDVKCVRRWSSRMSMKFKLDNMKYHACHSIMELYQRFKSTVTWLLLVLLLLLPLLLLLLLLFTHDARLLNRFQMDDYFSS